ncbi:histidine kinase [Catellatospora sp. KI3]|uniref:sensor histidine kinase n=1 Tax=Catellatospora sp. KI3 TaxID=3041620 RepID=UPI002482D979|nr:histidine kinase [Catellatospora sp. KI3]MDI1465373.1 histidine kinase [Catellatospora sp. KI3]
MTTTAGPLDRIVARAAVARAVLLGRTAATLAVTGGLLRLSTRPAPLLAVILLVLCTAVLALVCLVRHPRLVDRPFPVLAGDAALVVIVLGLDRGDVAFFCCAVGASALAGVLVGLRSLLLAAGYAGLGYLVAARLLDSVADAPSLAGFILAFPIANVLAAVAAAVTTAAVAGYVESSVYLLAAAQRTAAASERARLARELHDSVTKTLRGVSFAALALPASLRRQPGLAEQLAATVSAGATAAAEQARQVLEGLRLDDPAQEFAATVEQVCRQWSEREGVVVEVSVAPVDLPVDLRYELGQILRESLVNVARHAGASAVTVRLTQAAGTTALRVADNGRGFRVPTGLRGCLGLIGMAERAAAVDGTLRVVSAPGRGTVVETLVADSSSRAAAYAATPS